MICSQWIEQTPMWAIFKFVLSSGWKMKELGIFRMSQRQMKVDLYDHGSETWKLHIYRLEGKETFERYLVEWLLRAHCGGPVRRVPAGHVMSMIGHASFHHSTCPCAALEIDSFTFFPFLSLVPLLLVYGFPSDALHTHKPDASPHVSDMVCHPCPVVASFLWSNRLPVTFLCDIIQLKTSAHENRLCRWWWKFGGWNEKWVRHESVHFPTISSRIGGRRLVRLVRRNRSCFAVFIGCW